MTPLIIGIDPGTTQSAYVAWDGEFIRELGTEPNATVAKYLRTIDLDACVCIESVAYYGASVGREVFETCFWMGRFFQIARDRVGPRQVSRLSRNAVRKHLELKKSGNYKNVKAALERRLQRQPEDWHNLRSHQWSALAVAVTWWNTERVRQPLKGQVSQHADVVLSE